MKIKFRKKSIVVFFILMGLLLLLITACKTSDERQEEVDFEPSWEKQKDRASDAVEATEAVDRERRRQLELMDR